MKKNDEEDNTYEVRILCRNCKKDWIETVEKGIYIRNEKDNNYMIKADDHTHKKRKYFTCPKCESNKKIARLPLI